MMVANSFDLWQKDDFFSAAEEVQDSADIMESAYRLWVREKREGRAPDELNEFCRELQAALGTAKWQLDEFERAVRTSHRHCRDDTTLTRHKQFIAVIENQISRVESALQEAFCEDGKQPLRWVNLNEEERDDLAMFLSGTSQSSSQTSNSGSVKSRNSMKSFLAENPDGMKETEIVSTLNCSRDTSKEITSNDYNNSDCVIDIEEGESPGSIDARLRQTDRKAGTRKAWSSPNVSALRIVIPDEEEEEKKTLIAGIEATPKEKGAKPLFWMQKCREYSRHFDRANCFQREHQSPIRLRLSRPIQLTLSLMLMLFLLLPFVLYSS
ncbi:PREDICTED: uncharacterized protein LOC104803498 [Tarenaya hassleriana]|uniref:uncharacterized protein LOC104803498 n=1 Tax=Tarenaya hassleriana TaxID=28532 RepID=UPI00053C637F|nr:PREDICTED: uncharacterized protein LOC104803498 [Tarenaya hassleriana]